MAFLNCARGLAIATLAATVAPALGLAQQGPQGAAVGVSARFRAAGRFSQLPAIGAVLGAPSGQYDTTGVVDQVSQTLLIVPTEASPTLFVAATGLKSRVAVGQSVSGARESQVDNTMASGAISLGAPSAGDPARAAPNPDLLITAREIVSSASFSTTAGTRASAVGLTSIGALTLSGHLIDGAPRTYSGRMAPNTVLYRSPAVIVIANRQILSGDPGCDPDCQADPPGRTVTTIGVIAIDVALTGALVGGTKVSGEIKINQATAQ